MKGGCSRFVPLLLVFLAALVLKPALAKTYAVGGSQGWDESTDFDSWASSQTFKVGDELGFKYSSGLHSVVELAGESAYKSCDISSSLNSLNGGDNKVKLSKAGTRYFACGTSGHCQQGMKVKITTVAADGSSTSQSSPGATQSTSAASHQLPVLSFFTVAASSAVVYLALFV